MSTRAFGLIGAGLALGAGLSWFALQRSADGADGSPAATGASPAAAGAAESGGPDVLLVTLDTVRVDRLGAYGDLEIVSPHLDRFARQATVFPEAFAPAPLTGPTHASLFTGSYPAAHGLRDNGLYRLDDELPTLAARLGQAGWTTHAFISAAVLDRTFGLSRGFDRYDDDVRVGRPEAFAYSERAASQTNDALSGLELPAPSFLWVHYYDAHDPYVPPRPFDAFFDADPYRGEIQFVDWAWAGLWRRWQQRWNEGLVVVAADHGEALGDHGERTHGIFIYDEVMRVPLMIRRASQAPSIARGMVRLIDVAPTVLDLLGVAVPDAWEGTSVAGVWDGRSVPELDLFQESEFARNSFGWAPLRGVRTATHQYIEAPESELYDLQSDPLQRRNLAADAAETDLAPLRRRLAEYPGPSEPEESSVDLDAELAKKLESLGYVGAAGAVEGGTIDPKQGIGIHALLEQARSLLGDDQPVEALRLGLQVIGANPANVQAHSLVARCYGRMGQPDEAAKTLETAVSIRPLDYLYVALAEARLLSGRGEEGLEAYRKALDLNPRYAPAYVSWAGVLQATGDREGLTRLLDEAESVGLKDPFLFLLQGRLAGDAGDLEAAAQYFRRALEQNPLFGDAHEGLGRALYLQGRLDEAVVAYETAVRVSPGNVRILTALGALHLVERKDPVAARPYFERALARLPPGPEYDQVAGMLADIDAAMSRP